MTPVFLGYITGVRRVLVGYTPIYSVNRDFGFLKPRQQHYNKTDNDDTTKL